MVDRDSVLIVGIDSLIGRHLARHLAGAGVDVLGTTRRQPLAGSGTGIFLDLAAENPEIEVPHQVRAAVLCAAASGYAECENNPASHRINVVNAARLAEGFARRGIFTVFLSTNAVFSGDRPLHAEGDESDATTEYGRQKAEAERLMRGAARQQGLEHLLAILRLTKVISWDAPTFARWKAEWDGGQPVRPFSDLLFSPISLDYVTGAISRLISDRLGGTYHLSGAADISYARFARLLADALGLKAPAAVTPITSAEAGIVVTNSPRYPTMAMPATTAALGVMPQPAAVVAESLLRQLCPR
jgi:dTDP-4-dehydrorhamnose reductase